MTGPHVHDVEGLGPALRQELDTLAARATVPSATAVWLRAERQARRDALKQVERPIWFAERMALVGAGVVIGWIGTLAQDWLGSDGGQALLSALRSQEFLTASSVPMLAVAAAVLGGLALAAGALAIRSAD